MQGKNTESLEAVRQYWQEHMLYSFELDHSAPEIFIGGLKKIRCEDVDRFTLDYWQFDKFANKLVLDVGCGGGWLTVNYALRGARVYAIDLTQRAVELTKRHLRYKNTLASVDVGNAQDLSYQDNFFDLVVSSGVLHHTPDYYKAFKECYRVLKPKGKAKITLYRKGFLHRKFIFKFVKMIMKRLRIKHPGADLFKARDVDEFIRQYDGAENPLGIGKTDKEWQDVARRAGFIVKKTEGHYFPKRFIPVIKNMPVCIHFLLDRFFGTMVYFELEKP